MPRKPKAKPLPLQTVYSVKNGPVGTVWLRVGTATANRDGSLNVTLDVLPVDGVLHIRPPAYRPETKSTPCPGCQALSRM